jgi:BolA protein
MSVAQVMRESLTSQLKPIRLDIENESHLHAGHQGSPNTGESHFRVLIVSPMFAGLSRVERHRMVNDALADLLKSKVHALALRTYAPGETIG